MWSWLSSSICRKIGTHQQAQLCKRHKHVCYKGRCWAPQRQQHSLMGTRVTHHPGLPAWISKAKVKLRPLPGGYSGSQSDRPFSLVIRDDHTLHQPQAPQHLNVLLGALVSTRVKQLLQLCCRQVPCRGSGSLMYNVTKSGVVSLHDAF